jgi:hypothetical protein
LLFTSPFSDLDLHVAPIHLLIDSTNEVMRAKRQPALQY